MAISRKPGSPIFTASDAMILPTNVGIRAKRLIYTAEINHDDWRSSWLMQDMSAIARPLLET